MSDRGGGRNPHAIPGLYQRAVLEAVYKLIPGH